MRNPAQPLAFGTYDPLGVNTPSDATQTTTVTVQCVEELPATADPGPRPVPGHRFHRNHPASPDAVL